MENFGSAKNGDEDLIEVTFHPVRILLSKLFPEASNDPTTMGFPYLNNIETENITMFIPIPVPMQIFQVQSELQIETDSIGIIYKKDHTDPATVQVQVKALNLLQYFHPY